MSDRTGQRLGNYRLLQMLGTGAFAEVYLAEHLYLKSYAAVKVLHVSLQEKQSKSFLTEAQRLMSLRHPHIVRILDFAVDEDMPFLVMEYAPHGTLRTRHPKGSRLQLETIIPYVKQVADALRYVHEQKLVHRDIKPENMLLTANDDILLSDFGIASVAHATSSNIAQGLAGTIPYMAPEQIMGMPRPSSDQYALGIVVYEWLTGTRPFRGNELSIVHQQLYSSPPVLREQVPSIPPAVENVLFKALAKDPRQRFSNIGAFASALELASLSTEHTGQIKINQPISSDNTLYNLPASSDHQSEIATPSYFSFPSLEGPVNKVSPTDYPAALSIPNQAQPVSSGSNLSHPSIRFVFPPPFLKYITVARRDLLHGKPFLFMSLLFLVIFGSASGIFYVSHVLKGGPNNLGIEGNCPAGKLPIRARIFDRNGAILAWTNSNKQRHYTEPSLAGLIGYYISPRYPSTGIEHQFENYLNGSFKANETGTCPAAGSDIYLTIDLPIQRIIDQSFDITVPPDGKTVFQSKGGSIIVSDPHTGEILAMLSRPGYNANCVVSCNLAQLRENFVAKGYDTTIGCIAPCTLDQFKNALQNSGNDPNCEQHFSCNLLYLHQLEIDPARPLLDRPIESCYVPGWTYKTLTLVAGLDSGKDSLDERFYNDHGFDFPQYAQAVGPVTLGSGNDKEKFGPAGSNINGYTSTYPVDLRYGYTHSDEVIFAQVGVKMGAATWLDYNKRFYVGKQIPFDLPVRVSTVTPQSHLCQATPPNPTSLSEVQLAEDAFGQGVDNITPLQMALINNTVANNGHMMRPTLIYKIVDQDHTILQSFNPVELGTPISDTTASEVRDAMYGVIQCGDGSLTQAQLIGSNWSIIGKTGTGNQFDNTGKTPAQSWFITQAPYVYQSEPLPRITIVAMKENAGLGAFANGPMLRTIYDRIFSEVLKDVPPSPARDPNFCYNTGLLQTHP